MSLRSAGVKPGLVRTVERLSRMHARNAHLHGNRFSMDLCKSPANCQHFSMDVVYPKHVKMVANWGRGPRGPIRIDRDITRHMDRMLLGVHEVTEKFGHDTHGLCPCREAHLVAENIERKFARMKHVNLDDYETRIEFEFRKENPRLIRR